MGDEWIEVPFADAIDFQEGPGILAKDFHDVGVPLVRLAGLERGRPLLTGCNYLSPDVVGRRWSHFKLRQGDVLLSTSASLGRIAIVDGDGVGAIPYTGIIRMRPRDGRLVGPFIQYLLEGPDFQRQAEAFGVGSVIRHFGPSHLRQMTVKLPPPLEQSAIASVLGALDDKIELNRRMIETLEQIGRAVLQQWRDQQADDVQYLPLGALLAVLETGKRPKGGVKNVVTGVPSVGAESITGIGRFDFSKTKYVPREYFESMNRGVVEDFDVLLYKDGGRPGLFEPHVSMAGLGFPFQRFCINEHVYRLRVSPPHTQALLYYWLDSPTSREEMRTRGTGVAIPGLNSTAVRSLSFPVAPAEAVRQFSSIAEPVNSRILLAACESRTLELLRNALLPKLISGELRIPDAERIVSEVT